MNHVISQFAFDRGLAGPEYEVMSAGAVAKNVATINIVAEAIDCGRVNLAFQPVQRVGNAERPAFFEGLIRLHDARGEIIAPSEFISVVEPHSLGRRLDSLALKLGLDALKDQPTLRLSLNLSLASLLDPAWQKVLRDGLTVCADVAGRLILEITERMPFDISDRAKCMIKELRSLGVAFALDDFGAGQTSLRHLKEIYFDFLKIDGDFVRGISTDKNNQVVVSAIVSIARQFQMMTVAEKVETECDSRFLEAIGVDFLQGHYWGMPTTSPIWRSGHLDFHPACA